MQDVNKMLLGALKNLMEIHDDPAPFSGKTGEERMFALESQAAKRNAAIYSARQAIAAAEQAQQAEPVAWRAVIPGRRYTDKWDSARVADYNDGWNDYQKAVKSALAKLEGGGTE